MKTTEVYTFFFFKGMDHVVNGKYRIRLQDSASKPLEIFRLFIDLQAFLNESRKKHDDKFEICISEE